MVLICTTKPATADDLLMAIRAPDKERGHYLSKLALWSLACEHAEKKAGFLLGMIRSQTLVSLPSSGERIVGVGDRHGK